ncbi:MAG: hypothetical protein JEZ07_00485 [Phycisphaerae bacterium]|nr:hypothetical protein [Phycisphaerae bacterium]
MIDLFLKIGLSNACLSVVLAIAALTIGMKCRRPHIAHLLWVLVFVKLITPPIISVPVFPVDSENQTAMVAMDSSNNIFMETEIGPEAISETKNIDIVSTATIPAIVTIKQNGKIWLMAIWLIGSLTVLIWSLVRVYRFNRLLLAESKVGPAQLQTTAKKISQRLKLKNTPLIYTIQAHLSPMVWWAGNKVKIIIPIALLEKLDSQQQELIMAHELAHVYRRDYMVRWLEWLACVCFWWNPVVWLAQRKLRVTEEICCDQLVLASLNPQPKLYANSLLTAVEFLAKVAIRPPAMASEINSGGVLERRFKMIIANKTNREMSRWLKACILLFAIGLLPLSIANAKGTDHEAIGAKLKEAVQAGELTEKEAMAMWQALEKVSGEKNKKDLDLSWIEKAGQDLRKAVENGRITEKQAWEKWKSIKENKIAPQLKQAVKDGKLSEEQGWKIWQDIEKAEIGSMIESALAKGEITEKQAKEKWEAYNEYLNKSKDKKDLNLDWVKPAFEELKSAVEAGKLTEDQAWGKWAKIKNERIGSMLEKAVDQGKLTEEKARGIWHEVEKFEVGEKLKIAIAKGEISQADAKAKWEAYNKTPQKENELDLDWIAEIGNDIRQAAIRGEITEKQAWEKWAKIKEQRILPYLKEAVKEGRLTEAQARGLWQEIEKSEANERQTVENTKREMYSQAEKEIRKAVKDGKLSPKDADYRLKTIRNEFWPEKQKQDADSIEAKLRAAVKNGRLTEAQAREKWESLQKENR